MDMFILDHVYFVIYWRITLTYLSFVGSSLPSIWHTVHLSRCIFRTISKCSSYNTGFAIFLLSYLETLYSYCYKWKLYFRYSSNVKWFVHMNDIYFYILILYPLTYFLMVLFLVHFLGVLNIRANVQVEKFYTIFFHFYTANIFC